MMSDEQSNTSAQTLKEKRKAWLRAFDFEIDPFTGESSSDAPSQEEPFDELSGIYQSNARTRGPCFIFGSPRAGKTTLMNLIKSKHEQSLFPDKVLDTLVPDPDQQALMRNDDSRILPVIFPFQKLEQAQDKLRGSKATHHLAALLKDAILTALDTSFGRRFSAQCSAIKNLVEYSSPNWIKNPPGRGSEKHLADMNSNIISMFSKEEIKALFFNLGKDHEQFPDRTKGDLSQNLIHSMKNPHGIAELLQLLSSNRPDVDWEPKSVASNVVTQILKACQDKISIDGICLLIDVDYSQDQLVGANGTLLKIKILSALRMLATNSTFLRTPNTCIRFFVPKEEFLSDAFRNWPLREFGVHQIDWSLDRLRDTLRQRIRNCQKEPLKNEIYQEPILGYLCEEELRLNSGLDLDNVFIRYAQLMGTPEAMWSLGSRLIDMHVAPLAQDAATNKPLISRATLNSALQKEMLAKIQQLY